MLINLVPPLSKIVPLLFKDLENDPVSYLSCYLLHQRCEVLLGPTERGPKCFIHLCIYTLMCIV